MIARAFFSSAGAARRALRARRHTWARPLLGVLTAAAAAWATPSLALPSFAQQTGQPCAQCHVGAFGPQLKPYGRDFKLFGYVSSDGRNSLPTVAAVATASYTRTDSDRAALPGFKANDNFAFQSLLLAYAGRLVGGAGALAETLYDGVHDTWSIGTVDIKRAFNPTLGGKDLVIGLDANNRPTAQDLWNSTPAFEFSTTSSAFAASPAVSSLIDGKLSGRVAGVGAYGLYDNLLYGEFTAYSPLQNGFVADRLGLSTPANADVYAGAAPYWRVALQHDFHGVHYLEVGAYGLQASRFPYGQERDGEDTVTDAALDATYQYTGGKRSFVSAHATWIHEEDDLSASHPLRRTNSADRLDVARADAILSYDNTWTPAVEVFGTTGSVDKAFFKTPTGSPDSRGYVAELSYTPWGKAASPVIWTNARFTVRFVGYSEFNGRTARAGANDTLFVSTKLALAPLGAFVGR